MLKHIASFGQKIAGALNERTDYGVAEDSPFLAQINQYFEHFPMSSLLPYRSYDEAKGLFYNENSTGFVFETSSMVGCDEERQREISGLFQTMLPEGSFIQFTLWADPRIGGVLKYWEAARLRQGGVFAKLASRRVEHLRQMVFDK